MQPTAYAQTNSLTTQEPITTQEFVSNTLNNLPSNANDFSQAYLNPLIGSEQLSTPSGTKFDVELSCPTSNAFLTVMVQLSATGDLSFVQFSRDKDLDGAVDSVQTFPKAVSGVCATGLISCTPGTWNDCMGYRWDGDNDKLSLIETGINKLGGCYCINQSCGDKNRSQRILSSIATDLGTAAAQALAQHNPQYLISGAQTTGPIAKFYGQKLVGCGDGSATTLSNYYQAPQNIEAATDSYTTDANGIYQLVANSTTANSTATEVKRCSIHRQVHPLYSFDPNRTCNEECGNNQQTDRYLTPGTYTWTAGFTGTIEVSISRASGGTTAFEQHTLVSGAPQGFEINLPNVAVVEGVDYTLVIGAAAETSGTPSDDTVQGSGGVVQITYSGKRSCKEWIVNACDVIDNDTQCTLKDEIIDEVQTYKNYLPTGKLPISRWIAVQDLSYPTCGLQIQRPWQLVNRTYTCKTNTDLNFDTGINRNAVIQDSATTEHFNDVVNGLTTQRDLTLPDIQTQVSCTNACKTKRQKDKVSVAVSGPVTDNITQEWETLYRKCVGDEQNICPNEADERVITQCACLNEFGAASVMMQTLRQAAQGLICTQ